MITLTSSDGFSSATINPVGASLNELWVNSIQIAGSPDKFSGATLFPWPNRIHGGLWKYKGENFQLPVNDVQQTAALHGLVFEERFEWIQNRPNSCALTFVLEPHSGYPFPAEIRISYELHDSELTVMQEVLNTGNRTMPFAIGFHPYFLADESCNFSSNEFDLELKSVHVDETVRSDSHKARLVTSAYILDFYSAETGYFHIFTNRYDEPGRLWFAVEPQSSPADSLNNQVGITNLMPGDQKVFSHRLIWQ